MTKKKSKSKPVEPVVVAPASDMIPTEHQKNLVGSDKKPDKSLKVEEVIKQKPKLKARDIFDPKWDQIEYDGITQQDVDARFEKNRQRAYRNNPPKKSKK